MQPLGSGISRRNSNPKCGFSPYESHNIQTLNSSGLNNGKNHNLTMLLLANLGKNVSQVTRLTTVGNDSLGV